MSAKHKLKSAVIGYGASFNMGKKHAEMMQRYGFEFTAVCDINPERIAAVAADFPGIQTYAKAEELLAVPDIDLVAVVTPHNTHSFLARQVLESGKHCIIEKPMCIHEDEGAELLKIAKEKGLLLSVYHNRRWDGWYTALLDLLEKGVLGDIYHVELFHGGYQPPKNWWRSDKEISGGAFYDWGAHYIDWLLGLIPGKILSIRGFTQKRLFSEITNEDQVDSVIAFENGAVAHVQISSISYHKKPLRRILGTKGAVVHSGDGKLTVYTVEDGEQKQYEIPVEKGGGPHHLFYANIADHLYNGSDLTVKPEQALRTIAVIETTANSAAAGKELVFAFDQEGIP